MGGKGRSNLPDAGQNGPWRGGCPGLYNPPRRPNLESLSHVSPISGGVGDHGKIWDLPRVGRYEPISRTDEGEAGRGPRFASLGPWQMEMHICQSDMSGLQRSDQRCVVPGLRTASVSIMYMSDRIPVVEWRVSCACAPDLPNLDDLRHLQVRLTQGAGFVECIPSCDERRGAWRSRCACIAVCRATTVRSRSRCLP